MPDTKFQRVGEVIYEIGRSWRADMRVPVRVIADEELLSAIERDRSIE
jgi:tRNA-splicing ligase RtcB